MTKNYIESIQNPFKTKTLLISHFAPLKINDSVDSPFNIQFNVNNKHKQFWISLNISAPIDFPKVILIITLTVSCQNQLHPHEAITYKREETPLFIMPLNSIQHEVTIDFWLLFSISLVSLSFIESNRSVLNSKVAIDFLTCWFQYKCH